MQIKFETKRLRSLHFSVLRYREEKKKIWKFGNSLKLRCVSQQPTVCEHWIELECSDSNTFRSVADFMRFTGVWMPLKWSWAWSKALSATKNRMKRSFNKIVNVIYAWQQLIRLAIPIGFSVYCIFIHAKYRYIYMPNHY